MAEFYLQQFWRNKIVYSLSLTFQSPNTPKRWNVHKLQLLVGTNFLILTLACLTVFWSWRWGRLSTTQNAMGHFGSFLDFSSLLSQRCNSQIDIYRFGGVGSSSGGGGGSREAWNLSASESSTCMFKAWQRGKVKVFIST